MSSRGPPGCPVNLTPWAFPPGLSVPSAVPSAVQAPKPSTHASAEQVKRFKPVLASGFGLKHANHSETWTCMCGWRNHPRNLQCGGNAPRNEPRKYGCGTDRNQSELYVAQIKNHHDQENQMKKELQGHINALADNHKDLELVNKELVDEKFCVKILSGEVNDLNREISVLYSARRIEAKEKDALRASQQAAITDQRRDKLEIDRLNLIRVESRREIQRLMNQTEKCTEWIGHTLKLKFIFDEQEKIGALPSDHAEWIYPMVHDIVHPDSTNPDMSIFDGVDPSIIRRVLPSYDDAHMVHDGSEEQQAQRIDEWTHEASQIQMNETFSALLIEDRPLAISFVVRIQSHFRGAMVRQVYNPKKINASIIIQKILRGYLSRKVHFKKLEDLRWHLDRMLANPRASDRRSIQYINTGDVDVRFAWIRKDGTYGRDTIINPGRIIPVSISTYITHCFVIRKELDTDKFIHIPRTFQSGSTFDVHTGVNITKEYWIELGLRVRERVTAGERERERERERETERQTDTHSPQGYPDSVPAATRPFGSATSWTDLGCNCERCIRIRGGPYPPISDDSDEEDQDMVSIAIHNSLTITDAGPGFSDPAGPHDWLAVVVSPPDVDVE
jgi:hypothetical protein